MTLQVQQTGVIVGGGADLLDLKQGLAIITLDEQFYSYLQFSRIKLLMRKVCYSPHLVLPQVHNKPFIPILQMKAETTWWLLPPKDFS